MGRGMGTSDQAAAVAAAADSSCAGLQKMPY